jgi:MFS family permease
MSLWPGVGLGGEWGGAVLLAIENAPPNKRAWYVSAIRCTNWFVTFWWNFLDFNGYDEFPRFSGLWLEDSFIASSLLVVVGFYIRFKITETRFRKFQERTGRSENPVFTLLKFYKTS